jgi:hypothetical protein
LGDGLMTTSQQFFIDPASLTLKLPSALETPEVESLNEMSVFVAATADAVVGATMVSIEALGKDFTRLEMNGAVLEPSPIRPRSSAGSPAS